ncbi:MAG TPA: chemotaxis protein CheA [Verrucomicrobiae bacterium]|nr:chemotaxis protein CheA [Verrucomicrobiae bacterium]
MSGNFTSGLDPDLLDDFFAEAEQHLISIRHTLAQLEPWIGEAQPDPKLLEELFQNVHSFKGISAIAGLGPAEAVAHAAEDCLRKLARGQGHLTSELLAALMGTAQKLEQIVGAFRSGKPMPEYESLLTELKDRCDDLSALGAISATTPAHRAVAETPISSNIQEAPHRSLWKFKFRPSSELDARGVNVNLIRQQLTKLGEIVNTVPLVQGKGALFFEFLVSLAEPPANISEWEENGVSVEPAADKPDSKAERPGAPALPTEDHTPFLAPSHLVRVDLNRLDDLMRIAGEMVVQRSRLDTQLARLNLSQGRPDLREIHEVSGGLARSLRELREAIMRVRLVRVAEIFSRMPFVVQDLLRQTHKNVRLKLEGQDTSIDKYLVERLKDPLLHLVRNAFSHGIESPEERAAAKKPDQATIELKARPDGDSVLIQVRDDGRGINPRAILERAKSLGFNVPAVSNNDAILQILCSSGFSTRQDVDRASGRGIGMGVVYETIRELGGSLTMESKEHKGTQFTIRLPLTLAIAETLIVSAAGQTCAVPQSVVTEILHTTQEQVQVANGIEVVPYRAGVLPIVRLAGLFRLQSSATPKFWLLVISSERGSVGLLTEEVLGRREVVVRALKDPLIQVRGVSGVTELGDGKPVFILDGAALTSGSVRPPSKAALTAELN